MSTPTPLPCGLRAAAMAAFMTIAALAPFSASAAPGDDRFVAAMRLYHDDRYAAAYGRLLELADEGHAEAARIALLMLRFGPTLYRSQWSASQEQIQHWLALASRRQPVVVADAGD